MSSTSAQAHASVVDSAQQMRLRVLAAIQSSTGLTCDGVEERLGMRHQTASARVHELMKEGLIIDSGTRAATRSGAQAIVWVVNSIGSPLKWAGGKRALVPLLAQIYGPHRHRRLVEPFVGAMNVALGLRPERALLCDANPHLVNFHNRLRDPKPFMLEMRNSEHLYYRYRDAFNEINRTLRIDTQTGAELFYFLNRTCFNGLCRFNSDGEFNVPFGKYKTVTYHREFPLHALFMCNWEIRYQAFEETFKIVDGGDFLYLDPPYDGGFVDYSEGGFTWEDQVSLATRAAAHPGPVVASNLATERVLKLYRDLGFHIELISVKRSIAANGNRQDATEMLATKNTKGGTDS